MKSIAHSQLCRKNIQVKTPTLLQSSLFFGAALSAVLVIFSTVQAQSNEGHSRHFPKERTLESASRYSGRTPIDLTNGIPFNNGTYGKPNPNYEKWANASVVPGVSELNYPFNQKAEFIAGLQDSVEFAEDAIRNWKTTSSITKPEAKEYGEKSAATLQPLLGRLVESMREANSAGRNDWDKAQANARRALIDLRSTYASLHKNVR